MNFSEGFCYDDVLLIPKHSTLKSRSLVDTSVTIAGRTYAHPIIPANMKTITGKEMAEQIAETKGLAILHRFMPIEEQLSIVTELISQFSSDYIGVSIGVKSNDKEIVSMFYDAGVRVMCIDIAHGDSSHCAEMTSWIKNKYPDTTVIAGNVATGAGATYLWEAGADIVKAGVGPGCFAAGTRVLMQNGFYKNIEEIVPGDYVINKDGNGVKVINAFSTGIRKVSKLKNNSFYTDTFLTEDHQVWVGDLSSTSQNTIDNLGYQKILDLKSKTVPKQSKYKWKQIKDAQEDVLLFPKNINFEFAESFNITLNKRVGGNYKTGYAYNQDSNIIPNYNSGYLFGTFLGDGCASLTENDGSHSGDITWYFGKEEKDIANKVVNCIKEIFNKDAKIIETKNTLNVKFYYKPLADFLFTFGKKTNKHLPENLLVNELQYLQGLYDGLLDSDGHYGKDNRNSISNTSIKVIELFNIINFKLFGYLPNNSSKGKDPGGLKNCNSENMNESYLSRTLKQGQRRLTKDYYIVKNLGYEELNLEIPVYDITVDCNTHSFIANNMIVHNSLCTTRIETGNGVPQLTAIMDVAEARQKMITRSKASGDNKYYPFIADGGLKNSGDITKALCFADMVMAGNIFAGCEETPGEILLVDNIPHKHYVGSSTHKANHIEGVAAFVMCKGKFKDVLGKLLEGVRSGMSYQGATNLTEMKDSPQFVRITNAGLRESLPHDVRL